MTQFSFTEKALDEYGEWAKNHPKIFQRIRELLREIKQTPFKGTGKPEPLRYQFKGYWSTRIDEKNRLIYRVVSQNEILIISCKGHYD